MTIRITGIDETDMNNITRDIGETFIDIYLIEREPLLYELRMCAVQSISRIESGKYLEITMINGFRTRIAYENYQQITIE